MNKIERAEAGIAGAPAKAMSAVKDINIPSLTQKIKDIKLPDLPSIGNLKF